MQNNKRFRLLALVVVAGLNACGNSDISKLPGGAAAPVDGSADFLNVAGPKLGVEPSLLDAALSCTADVVNAQREVVLITPAFSTAEESFGGYLRQLPFLGIPTCSITLPDHGFADLQNAAEYVVYAIRKISAISGQKIILFGHQHGPLDQLWALAFWPDLPAKVVSAISLATPHNGTQAATVACNAGMRCAPSEWQIAGGSLFITALNARPAPAGVAITSIATMFDEVIVPQPAVSHREGATNIVLQDICPGHMVEHFTILTDNLTYELVLDAINNPGKGSDVTHLPADICSGPRTMPSPEAGGEPAAEDDGPGFFVEFPINTLMGVDAEPPLKAYAVAP